MVAKKNVTFADIARYTGFSKTTISRYFNNPSSLTMENQAIIKDALIKLDYKENKVAKILANGQTEFIGVIIPDIYHHYYSEVLNEILGTYEQFGYKFLVFIGNTKEEIERKYIRELMSYKIEGLIILSHTISSIELMNLKLPVVAIEREDQYISSVNTDNYAGGRMAAKLLQNCKCDVLIQVHSDRTNTLIPAYQRMIGFKDYCKENNLCVETIFKKLSREPEQMKHVLGEITDLVTAEYGGQKKGIFLTSDTYANVMVNQLVRKYHCFPEDFYIVGFDNSSVSRDSVVTISTIGQQIDKIATEALELLIMQLSQKKEDPSGIFEPVHKLVPPVLYERETTKINRE